MRQLLPKLLFAAATLIAAGLGCSAGRNAGQSCAETADCRPELICFAGECTVPGSCPSHTPVDCGDGCCPQALSTCCSDGNCYASTAECKAATCTKTGGACRLSGDCCTGLTCRLGRCATLSADPVCGNNKCETGENQANCCKDCGCPAGTACQAGTCKTTATVLNWTVSNGCRNGEDIEVRFFAVDRGLAWPGGDQVYISKQGSMFTQALSCVPNEKICLGAWQPGSGLLWGVGIDRTEGCTDCCRTCANASTSYGPMTCP